MNSNGRGIRGWFGWFGLWLCPADTTMARNCAYVACACRYVEFNTSYRLDIADTKHMPPSEVKVSVYSRLRARLGSHQVIGPFRIARDLLQAEEAQPYSIFESCIVHTQASKMVDEVCSAWAMINFKRCCQVGAPQEVSVPLYYGSLYEPQVGMHMHIHANIRVYSHMHALHIATYVLNQVCVPLYYGSLYEPQVGLRCVRVHAHACGYTCVSTHACTCACT